MLSVFRIAGDAVDGPGRKSLTGLTLTSNSAVDEAFDASVAVIFTVSTPCQSSSDIYDSVERAELMVARDPWMTSEPETDAAASGCFERCVSTRSRFMTPGLVLGPRFASFIPPRRNVSVYEASPPKRASVAVWWTASTP